MKKISPEQVEVLGVGTHAKPIERQRSGIKVVNAGPLGLLAIPLAIVFLPVLMIGLILLSLLAVFFGRSVFKVIRFK